MKRIQLKGEKTMRFFSVIALVCLVVLGLPRDALGQTTATGNITRASAACAESAGCVSLDMSNAAGSVSILITGTWSATLEFETSTNGTGSPVSGTWDGLSCTPLPTGAAATAASANDTWQCNVAALSSVRVRASSYTSGTAVVTIKGSMASTASGGSSSLGTTIDDTEMTAEDFGDFTCTGSEDGCTVDSGAVAVTELAAASSADFFGVLNDESGTGGVVPVLCLTSLTTNDLITWNGTCWVNGPVGVSVNAQTDVTYTVDTLDRNKRVTFSNAGAVAVTLPQAGSAGFAGGFAFLARNLGAGAATITPTTSTIDGGATLVLSQNECAWIYTSAAGTDYETDNISNCAGAGGGVTVVNSISLLNWSTLPDATTRAFFEPYPTKATNDIFKHNVLVLKNPGASEVGGVYGTIFVPTSCTGSEQIRVAYTSTVTGAGVVNLAFDYRAISGTDTESLDQATFQEEIDFSSTGPSATDERMIVTGALTGGNFAALDTVEFYFYRHDEAGIDTLAGDITVHGAWLDCTLE